MTLSRREFLSRTTAAAGAVWAVGGVSAAAYPLDGVMGLQSADVEELEPGVVHALRFARLRP